MRTLFFVPAIVLFTNPALALSLDEFLDRVRSRHEGIKSLQVSKEAAEDRFHAGDIGLVPILSLKGSYLEDKKQPNFYGGDALKVSQYTLGLSKKFSTGTQVSMSANTIGSENTNVANPMFASYAKYAQGSLGVSLSQSLWKDFFGQGTRLRQERERYSFAAEKGNYNLQEQLLLVEAEAAFWDGLYLNQEMGQREESLKRAQKIEAWMRRRVSDGISDRADLLSAQSLVANRQLQLLNTKDELVASQRRLRDLLSLAEGEVLPELTGKIDIRRKLPSRLREAKKIIRLDSYLSGIEAKAKETAAKEVEDSLLSDLVLSGSYNTNSYEANGSAPDGTKNWNKQDTPTSVVSLTWTYMFDTSVKESARSVARREALAAQLRSERKARESRQSWEEFLRRSEELVKKIEAARIISKLTIERAKAEQDKLSKGRSITQNVINSEQDAAEAELNLTKMMAEQRKLESQSHLFIAAEDL